MTGADYGICGEGEAGFVSLLAALNNGRNFSGIPGLVYRENGNIVINPPAGIPGGQTLEAGDRPANRLGLLPAHQRHAEPPDPARLRAATVVIALIRSLKAGITGVAPLEAVADEFEQLQRLGARYVFIVDSVFNSSPRHVAEICEAILRRNVKMSWGCFLRPQGLTPELMRLMKRAGLAHIEFGSDSFCDEVLAAYQKGLTFDDILHSSELASQENDRFLPFSHQRRAG